eukprot:COSAG06_NODE_5759_length_3288_cov_52.533082_3_plen_76_part_00
MQNELGAVLALVLRAGIDLRKYVGTTPAEDWNLPYFNDVRASEEKRKQHLYRFLTEPPHPHGRSRRMGPLGPGWP